MIKIKKISLLTLIIGQILFLAPHPLLAGTEKTGPEVKVFRFSPELKESIKDTRDKFAVFEEGIAPIVENLSKLSEEYAALQCRDSMDKGCRDLESKIKAKYQEFLDSLASRVATLEKSARKSMGKIHDHFRAVGSRTYPRDIAHEMNRKNKNVRPEGPMSARLNKVLQLLGSSKVSLMELASNMSLDMVMAVDQLSAIEMSIESQRDAIALGVSFGEIHDWMLETTKSVRGVLGLDTQDFYPRMDINQPTETDYLS